MALVFAQMVDSINLWHVTLWKEVDGKPEKIEPYNYIVALPKTQAIGHIVARQQIITGGMLPEEAYAYEDDRRVLAKGYSVDVDVVEWEQPGNIARLFV